MTCYALDGHAPTLPPAGRYWIAPGAHLIGKVILKEDASVWFNAVLRGDNEPLTIGARSNIQDNAVLHADMGFPLDVGEDCTIGHAAILHGCTIGDGALVGMGATVLNGARIGKGSLIGANALIKEKSEFPDFALIVGAPARVVRVLDPEDAARMKAGATHYVGNWQRFAKGLKPV